MVGSAFFIKLRREQLWETMHLQQVNYASIHLKNFDYPEKPLKYKHIRRISD